MRLQDPSQHPYSSLQTPHKVWFGSVIALALAGLWLYVALPGRSALRPALSLESHPAAIPGTALTMESPPFRYSADWQVSALGADPAEPSAPGQTPAGVVTFPYDGSELALQLAVGDYWAYLLITVDGEPANLLPALPGLTDSTGRRTGYLPLYAPEAQTAAGPTTRWVRIHRAAHAGPHQVRVEVWRGWSRLPLRGVAVDALPPAPLPLWPALLLGTLGLWSGWLALRQPLGRWVAAAVGSRTAAAPGRRLARPMSVTLTAAAGVSLIAASLLGAGWIVCLAGLALLGLASLWRPLLWLAALLFGLPFYLFPLPLLPMQSLNLVEVGVWGGLGLLLAHKLLCLAARRSAPAAVCRSAHSLTPPREWAPALLVLLVILALAAAGEATQTAPAWREWRTVFLSGALFALLLRALLAYSDRPEQDRLWLVAAWTAGGTAVALVSLWYYAQGEQSIAAEGVRRLRGVYGSPNNLALYLERTLLVGAALALFVPSRRQQLCWALLVLPQAVALLLTFSKGSLILGLPIGGSVLGIGGWLLLTAQGRDRRPLWWLAAAVLATLLALTPFLATERLRQLVNTTPGSSGFFRVHLWQSAWQMALNHPLWGVGPDNFLYAYRSGYILPAAWQEPDLNHPHNFLLDWWTRLGLPGLGVALAFFAAVGQTLGRQLRSSPLAVGLLAAGAAALAHGLIDASYALPDLMLGWMVIAFVTGRSGQSLRPG